MHFFNNLGTDSEINRENVIVQYLLYCKFHIGGKVRFVRGPNIRPVCLSACATIPLESGSIYSGLKVYIF